MTDFIIAFYFMSGMFMAGMFFRQELDNGISLILLFWTIMFFIFWLPALVFVLAKEHIWESKPGTYIRDCYSVIKILYFEKLPDVEEMERRIERLSYKNFKDRWQVKAIVKHYKKHI